MRKIDFIRVIRKTGTSLAISIPPEIIELLELKEGTFIKVNIEKIDRK
jgi:antitoxin component of MazEF toxin-antitoxin module